MSAIDDLRRTTWRIFSFVDTIGKYISQRNNTGTSQSSRRRREKLYHAEAVGPCFVVGISIKEALMSFRNLPYSAYFIFDPMKMRL